MSLFEESSSLEERMPLAARIRPTSLDEFVGQTHIAGAPSPIRRAIERGGLGSVILWGPAGCGKTTLARLIASHASAHLEERSAVTCGVAEIRRIAQEAQRRQKPTVLLLDEIHHFNRSQQDFLLGFVEEGVFTLIGATTENPTFSLSTPLLSRCRVLVLRPLTDAEVETIVKRGEAAMALHLEDDARDLAVRFANGDARVALNAVELGGQLAYPSNVVGAEQIAQAMNRPVIRYDSRGDQHYDVISAFIKSVRGSDVDAALHYLARMLKAGEDPRFIARRLVILASEDIGNAAPMGLLVSMAAFHAVERIGMPEARIVLAQATIFLAASPKSNSAYLAIEKAMGDLERTQAPRVPEHLRNPNTLRFGEKVETKYKYPHDFGGWVKQEYLAEGHSLDLPYYTPIARGCEKKLAEFLASLEEEK